ncbi:hypothetical protein [Streptomyces sp. NRRL S-378]|uniref:hypothetical protein n=1 Tax=Streptomyces sp. NRRL S-378 TaxID=1463904 RepID=UPI00131CFF01|nr:hypothetical protein [Streptomyces sp. NRRL S-378]
MSKSWRKKIIEANVCMPLGWRGCALASAISGMLLATFRSGAKNNAIRHFMWQASLTFYFGARAAKGAETRMNGARPDATPTSTSTTTPSPASLPCGTGGPC